MYRVQVQVHYIDNVCDVLHVCRKKNALLLLIYVRNVYVCECKITHNRKIVPYFYEWVCSRTSTISVDDFS